MRRTIKTCVLALFVATAIWAEPIREEFDVGDTDPNELMALLQTLVPEIKLEAEGGKLILISGSREIIEQGLELLRQLDRPMDLVSLRVQLVGLSPAEQERLGIKWQRAAVGNAAGMTYMNHYVGQSAQPLGNLLEGSVSDQLVANNSGSETAFHWSDPMVCHFFESGRLVKQNSAVGLDLEVTTTVKSDGYAVCKFFFVTHLLGRRIEEYSDVRIKSGESVAVRNLFATEPRPPAFASLPTLGALFQTPSEPVLSVTPTILEDHAGGW